eukprot:scaffold25633_cov101-Isochrysis_galbana.AAC.1
MSRAMCASLLALSEEVRPLESRIVVGENDGVTLPSASVMGTCVEDVEADDVTGGARAGGTR